MKTLTKRITLNTLTAAMVGAALFSLGTPAMAQEVKAKLGTSLPESHPQTIGARKFAELADKKSNGRIKITVYSSAQLGSDQQMQAAMRGGTQEFSVPSTATLANLVKEFGVIGLPFSFASEKQADAVLDGPFGQSLMARLPEKGLVGLAFWENGFRNFTNSKRPIQKAEDMSGLKVRTMQNNLYIDLFNGLGSNAVPMPVNELFTALETRAVDAQENPFTVVHAQKFYDVQKYLSVTGHAYDALALVASKKFWDGLKPEDRTALQAAAVEATAFERQTSRELNGKMRGELVKLGMQVNDVSDAERQRMRDKLAPVIAKHQAAVGDETAKEFFAAIAKAPK
ncbi:tripartite ATP-independent transporter solute receptor, DctP family [Polaromonas sp. OV174]|uniref:TRAP transporter substrate-binding protein n=1 Tax=Polaromonas sp. OV174 TaxID=1855300 RepID=UPI0008E922B2|nr:TRAP transporter substrate-binding protein [Polaromonas sp. OV174]SFC64897.1 tripartite ATP-independent transporter solute receptor, DctP family [Polaromonas sp. OV174]